MQVGHVVATIEIVIDKDFPVTLQLKLTPLRKMQRIEPQGRTLFDESAQMLLQRAGLLVEIDEDEPFFA
jgi:hypothetical protein